MKITNARITNLKVGFDDGNRLAVMINFESQHGCCLWSFVMSNPVDVQRLSALMNYTNTYDLNDLNGKIIRKVDLDCFMRGFGHPIEDKFVLLSEKEFSEITEADLEMIYGK